MNSLDMLKTDEGQLNAVFALFGSAAQHSQFFEAALEEFLMVYNRLCRASVTLADLEAIETKLARKTMGSLLVELRKFVAIDDERVTKLLDEALKQRNFLIHSFFRVRAKLFDTKEGRFEAFSELLSVGNLLEQAAGLTRAMAIALEEAMDGGKKGDPNSPAVFSMTVSVDDGKNVGKP